MKKLFLFDFDGTLTKKDTFIQFLFFCRPVLTIISFPYLVILVLLINIKFLSSKKAKEIILSFFFKGLSKKNLYEKGKFFIDNLLYQETLHHNKFRKNALETIIKYKKSNLRVIIVSASLDIWIKPFSDMFGVEYIATNLMYKNGVFFGKILGENCKGIEKVNRLKSEIVNINNYLIYAYGDSNGDREMLEYSDFPFFRHFQ